MTVTPTFGDALSGVAGAGPAAQTIGEGAGQSATFTVSDKAGNSASTVLGGINVDKTAPSLTAAADRAANAAGWYNADVTVTPSASDALSGLVDNSLSPANSVISAEGDNLSSAQFSVADKAGNTTTFTLTGVKIDKTAPTVSGSRDANSAANANGWNKGSVKVGFSCADKGPAAGVIPSGVDSAPGDVTKSAEGADQSASGTCTDRAGNSATATVGGINIDLTAPTASSVRKAGFAANANGWNKTNVTVIDSASDSLSGLVNAANYPQEYTFLNEGADQAHSFMVSDLAGNTATGSISGVNIDKTAPAISAAADRAPNGAGWYNADVTVSTTCGDALSGVAGICPAQQFGEGANQTATFTIFDKAGNSASASLTGINVDKSAPVVKIISPASGAIFAASSSVPVAFSGTVVDLSGAASATWSFDSTTKPGAISGGDVTGSSLFTTAGVYQLSLSVTDKAGNPAVVVSTVGDSGLTAQFIIYDPSAGFVTGGGWINSPAEALVKNVNGTIMGVAGKATFGFVSKYQRGATVPTGETEFQFKTGNLNFKSTKYQWLTVAGARAQYKGEGTINGAGRYGFILTAVDSGINGGGNADRFRVKIFEINAADGADTSQVIYDNQISTADADGLTGTATLLGGGSIVIHTGGK